MSLNLTHYVSERNAWQRVVDFMEEENINLKNQLSVILNEQFEYKFLADLEEFQNRFLQEDAALRLLKSQVSNLDKLLVRELFEDGKILKEVQRMMTTLRHEMISEGVQFDKLKFDFYTYLAENLSVHQ